MLKRVHAMSSAERQRRFREGHPGYYARIQARKRGSARAAVARRRAAERALAATIQPQAQTIPPTIPAPPIAAASPAPAVMPELAEVKTIEPMSAPAPQPLAQAA